jgi:hypothetical protein
VKFLGHGIRNPYASYTNLQAELGHEVLYQFQSHRFKPFGKLKVIAFHFQSFVTDYSVTLTSDNRYKQRYT